MTKVVRRRQSRREEPSEGTLPTFKLGDSYRTAIGEDTRERAVIEVICPRRGCGLPFVVLKKEWPTSSEYRTRPCPMCFKTAKIPGELL